jgi:hypothetical protein
VGSGKGGVGTGGRGGSGGTGGAETGSPGWPAGGVAGPLDPVDGWGRAGPGEAPAAAPGVPSAAGLGGGVEVPAGRVEGVAAGCDRPRSTNRSVTARDSPVSAASASRASTTAAASSGSRRRPEKDLCGCMLKCAGSRLGYQLSSSELISWAQ